MVTTFSKTVVPLALPQVGGATHVLTPISLPLDKHKPACKSKLPQTSVHHGPKRVCSLSDKQIKYHFSAITPRSLYSSPENRPRQDVRLQRTEPKSQLKHLRVFRLAPLTLPRLQPAASNRAGACEASFPSHLTPPYTHTPLPSLSHWSPGLQSGLYAFFGRERSGSLGLLVELSLECAAQVPSRLLTIIYDEVDSPSPKQPPSADWAAWDKRCVRGEAVPGIPDSPPGSLNVFSTPR